MWDQIVQQAHQFREHIITHDSIQKQMGYTDITNPQLEIKLVQH